MKPSKRKPLAGAEALILLEQKLQRSRRRFRRLTQTWLIGSGFLLFIWLTSASQANDPESRFAPVMLILILGNIVAVRGAQVLGSHPRILVAQRELLQHRAAELDPSDSHSSGLEPAGTSTAALHDRIAASTQRLRGRVSTLTPSPTRLAAALTQAEATAEALFDRLADVSVEAARAKLRQGPEETPGDAARLEDRLRTELEAYRLTLATLELDDLLDPELLAQDGADRLTAARERALQALPSPESGRQLRISRDARP